MATASSSTTSPSSQSTAYPSPRLLTWTLAIVNFCQVLDSTILNVSLPAITGDLGTSPSQGAMIVTSYSVAQAITVPLTGWLAGRFGQVRMMVLATMMFGLMSLLSAFAWSLNSLITFRVLQGAAGGLMIPLSQALMLGHNPPERRGQALALWSMTTMTGPILGPVVGGWITDNIGWSWIFLINVPISFLAAFGVWTMLKDRESALVKLPLDGVGLVLLVIWVASLQVVLDTGNESGWFDSDLIVRLTVVAALGFALFLVWELTERHPIVDLSLFRERNFLIAVLAMSIAFCNNRGTMLILPLWLQTQVGYTAQWAGNVLALSGLMALMLAPFIGRSLRFVEPRLYSTLSFSIFGIGYYWRAHFTGDADYWTYALPQAIQGIGVAMFFVPLISMSMGNIPQHKLAAAAGLQSFARSVLGSFGISIYILMWNRREALHRTQMAEHVNVWSAPTTEYMDRLASTGMAQEQMYAHIDRLLTQQAYTMATNDIYWVALSSSIALIALVWFARPPFNTSGKARPG